MDGKYLEWIYFLQKIITGCNIFFSCKTFFCSVWTVGKKNRIFFVSSWILFFLLKRCEAEWKKVRGKGHFLKCFCIFFTFTHEKQNKIFVSHMKNYFSPGKKKSTTNIFHTQTFFFLNCFHPLFFSHMKIKKNLRRSFTKKFEWLCKKFFFTSSQVINTGRKTVRIGTRRKCYSR